MRRIETLEGRDSLSVEVESGRVRRLRSKARERGEIRREPMAPVPPMRRTLVMGGVVVVVEDMVVGDAIVGFVVWRRLLDVDSLGFTLDRWMCVCCVSGALAGISPHIYIYICSSEPY